jgi:hypothetical protein
VQSVSTTTKLRQKFYAQVQRRSFCTVWVIFGPWAAPSEVRSSPNSGHAATAVACPFRADIVAKVPKGAPANFRQRTKQATIADQ